MNRSTQRILYAVALFSFLCVSCSKSVDSKSKTFTYPLALGNQWTYSLVGTHEYGDPLKVDTTGTMTFRVTVERVDTVPPGVLAYTMREIKVGSAMPDEIPERTYLNYPEGMYLLSWNSARGGVTLPRQVPHASDIVSRDPPLAGFPYMPGAVSSNPLFMGFPGADEFMPAQRTNLADTLPLVLPYPQHSGMIWTYYDSTDSWPYRAERVIEGRETITTPAGKFDCWRIRHIPPANWATLHTTSYISAEGLIRRRNSMYFSSTGDWVDTFTLVSFELHLQ